MSKQSESAPGPRPESSMRWLLPVCALLVGLAAGGAAGYQYARQSTAVSDSVVVSAEQAAAQDAAVRQSQAESRFLRAQLDTADGEIAVERAARQELETQLRSTQDELGRVRDRLAFFEQLLPPGPEGAVDIRGAEIQREGAGLKYRVLLMRSGRSETPFSGMLRFQAAGVLKGETVSVDLAPMQVKADTPADPGAVPAAGGGPLALQFDQYQRNEGVLELPQGFVPETVTISVLEGSTVRAARTIKLEF
ncbi:DUF6776 family protein [Bordetella petrii]|uniref:DUF6776 family protein n=1 Tax=Bordetella petrii TaxID=94624 RepID=UPI001E2B590C|nr:DUF6776 family protein [Bordetella petrii]MCD0504202.1 hypothetical protein [Bordetella petrii]